ncbi:MAG TPA: tRNA pseudouridine(55) synthase TruB [Bryobacteraceae bacterium]|nr:tRNA pseudouridine(55) synthase TruB [Bryobacteraceae bacterium]
MDGLIVVDKPQGWTSHDVVNRLRRLLNLRSVGHLGTLDPMATGVLPAMIGRATRLARFFQQSDKVYEGTIRFGFSTDTYDAEGTPSSANVEINFDAAQLEPVLARFRGKISQVPPAVSAKKVGGTRAYKLARRNIEVHLNPVDVEIFSLDLLDTPGSEARVRIHCSAGTYIRSIAHDVGVALGCGAHLSALRRTRSGSFHSGMAHTLEELDTMAREGRIADALVPAADLLPEFPIERVDDSTAVFIRQGRDFRVSPFGVTQGTRFVKAVSQTGDLIAIGEAKLPHLYHPILVLS